MAYDDPGFLGRGWAFPPQFDPFSGAVSLVTADEDIYQSLRILFETRPGERVMHPTFGCRIFDYIFDPLNAATLRKMEAAIARAILFFEPRIDVDQTKVSVADAAEGRLLISLTYRIRQTNSRANVVFPFYIREGTLVTAAPVVEG
jgi:phage baseplate assembly protein W